MKKLFLFFLIGVSANLIAQVEFREFNDWSKVVETAEAEGKFIFLDAYTDWCYWCKVQDKELFTKEEVGKYLNENFIPVKINFEDSLGLVLSRKFRVWGYPTLLYFNPDGELVHKQVGYTADANDFIDIGNAAMKFKKGQRYGYSSKNLQPNFPDFYISSLAEPDKRTKADQETVVAYLDKQEDLFTEESWSVMFRFNINKKYEDYFVENYDKYKSIFGKEETESMLYQTAYYGVVAAANEKDEATMKKWCDISAEKMESDKPDDIKDNLCMTYFEKTGEYDKYIAIAEGKINRDGVENTGWINGIAWNAYENIDDDELLKKAASWMAKVIDIEPKYMFVDTYAALLFKSGNIKGGKKWAKKAIKIGKTDGEKVEDTEKLIEKFTPNKK